MEQEKAHILLYVKGMLDEEGTLAMDSLYNASPEFRKKVNDIAYVHGLLENAAQQKKIDTKAGWAALSKRIGQSRKKAIRLYRMISAAAAVLIIAFSWTFIVRMLSHNSEQNYITITSPATAVKKVVLPDGSQVWLNASSTLSYPKQFAPGSRSVHLEGEAYFKVTSDKKNRFDVIMKNGMKVSAYGTEFNVMAYPHQNRYSVLLAHGHVDVYIPETKQTKSLITGEEITVATAGKVQTTAQPQPEVAMKTDEDAQISTAWKDGKMVFYRKTLGHIADRLSGKYDVTIQFTDSSLRNQEYTATFDNENITEILDLLQRAGKFRYEVRNPVGQKQEITISKTE